MNHVHHVHLFASDLEKSIAFYREGFGGAVILDMDLAGARNVFMRIGTGRIHFYDQPPSNPGRGSIHHFGIQTDDIERVVARLKGMGVSFSKDITDLGVWKYIMVPAPDEVIIELFQVDKGAIPAEYSSYFD
ncbi:MAG TPA: VOC family protein [Deltaproteobacteria bacterium]|nr:VOC family protein [Deltaproteobacteria bacterium]HPR54995.1 VOC family protein [Deltaproteobacteria bacterium]HXK46332.1 VOC family protein [Deltaproteobacteria bacterium]